MVFLIQNTQNRDGAALQLKLDELIRAMKGAQNSVMSLEDMTEEELERLKAHYYQLAGRPRQDEAEGRRWTRLLRPSPGAARPRSGRSPGWGKAATKASTAWGSSWVPATRRSSVTAASAGLESRYGRRVVMASNASATATMRASIGNLLSPQTIGKSRPIQPLMM